MSFLAHLSILQATMACLRTDTYSIVPKSMEHNFFALPTRLIKGTAAIKFKKRNFMKNFNFVHTVMFEKNYCAVCCSLLLSFIAACGGGGGGSSGAADTTAPAVAPASPASGSSGVSPIADLRVNLSETANAATVNGANVHLVGNNLEGANQTVSANISYDAASHSIVINPSQPLAPNTSYALTLIGVQDSAGNNLPSTVISFKTLINPALRQVFYSAGNISSYFARAYDANGNQTRFIRYSASGSDSVWFSGDDQINQLGEISYDENGKPIRSVTVSGPGSDTQWLTADDIVSEYEKNVYDAAGNLIRNISSDGAGLDGQWFSADDRATQRSDYSYATGKQTGFAFYNGAGGGARWDTDDDVVNHYSTTTYNANGKPARIISYSGPSANNTWFDNDDQVAQHCDYTYDANGNHKVTRIASFSGAGLDGIWFNGDDDGSYGKNTYDANGDLTRIDYLSSAGNDEI